MKKANLLPEEVAKLVIAAVCIALLLYLGWMLYNMSTQKTRMEQARLNLEEMAGKMSMMKKLQSIEFTLLSPNGYLLTGWPYEAEGISIMPDTCVNNKWKSCVCFCRFDEKTEFVGDSVINLGGVFTGIPELLLAVSESGLPRAVAASCVNEGVCRETPGGYKASTSSVIYVNDESFLKSVGKNIQIANKYGGGAIREFERFFAIRVEDLIKNGASVKITLNSDTYVMEPVI